MHYYPGVTLDQQYNSFRKQYLERKGWHLSFQERASRDDKGPVPWFTYPALAMLNKMVRPEWQVFEYGGGSSTEWFSQRCGKVTTIEHDEEWSNHLKSCGSSNNLVRHIPARSPIQAQNEEFMAPFFSQNSDPIVIDRQAREYRAGLMNEEFKAYASAILELDTRQDVVVVDGMARTLCTWIAVRLPKAPPLIVFDNSDRPDYQFAYNELSLAGYRRIDFWGPGPMNPYEWCTSLFVRSLDILPA